MAELKVENSLSMNNFQTGDILPVMDVIKKTDHTSQLGECTWLPSMPSTQADRMDCFMRTSLQKHSRVSMALWLRSYSTTPGKRIRPTNIPSRTRQPKHIPVPCTRTGCISFKVPSQPASSKVFSRPWSCVELFQSL